MASGDEDFETNYEDTPTIETSRGSHDGHEIITTDDINGLDNTKPQQGSTPPLETVNTIHSNNNDDIPTNNINHASNNDQTRGDSPELQIIYSDKTSHTQSQVALMPELTAKGSSNIPTTDLANCGVSNVSTVNSSDDDMDGLIELSPPKTISKINARDVNLAFHSNHSNHLSDDNHHDLIKNYKNTPRSKSKTYTVELSPSPKPRTSFRTSMNSKMSNDGFKIDVGTDTDSDDELDGDELRRERMDMLRVTTRYDDNEFKHLPYEQELIERLSIALTYLLHERSPLWITEEDAKDDEDYEFDPDEFLSAISPKSERESMRNNLKVDKPKFGYKYSTEKAPFQKKCQEYTTDGNALMGQLRSAEKKLNSLYDQSYHARWKSLHYFWVDWKQHAEMLLHEYEAKKEGNDEAMIDDNKDDDEPFDELTLEEEEKLEDDTDDFLEKFSDVMQELMVNHPTTTRAGSLHGSSGVIDKFIKKTTDRAAAFKMEDPAAKYKLKAGKTHHAKSYESEGGTLHGDTTRAKGLGSLGSLHGPVGFGSQKKSRSHSTGKNGVNEPTVNGKIVKIGVLKKNQPIPLIGNKFKSKAMNLLTKEDELRAVKNRNEMKAWIAKHKHTGIKWGDGVNELDATETAKMKNREGKCTTFMNNVKALFKKEEFVKGVPLHLPMYAWTWQHLVSFIESEEQYKRFSSIFWEYRINGQEICNMKSKQIELLIECSVLNNSKLFETEFDEFKLLSSRTAFYQTDPDAQDFHKSNQWEISLQADELYEYIVKGRVQSQIVSRYYTAWDVVKQISNNDKHPSNHRAKHIVDLVTLLRAEPAAGPKKFWKMDAIFFNKIDNYLMALMGRGSVRTIFQKYWPDFLYEEPIELPSRGSPKKPPQDLPEAITRKASGSIIGTLDKQMSMSSLSNAYHLPAKRSVNGLNATISPATRQSKFAISPNMSMGRSSILMMNTTQFKSVINMAQAQRSPAPHKIPSNSKLSIPTQSRQGTLTKPLKNQGQYLGAPRDDDEEPSHSQGNTPSMRPSKMMGLLGVGDGPSRKSNANMSTTTMASDASFKYDYVDKIADKCCGCKKCEPFQEWIHNLKRIYVSILCVIVLAMTLGCLFTNLWYFYGSTNQTDQAMELAIESIGERARNQLLFEYWVPQLFTGYLISGVMTGAYKVDLETVAGPPINNKYNTDYDAFFGGFAEISYSAAMFSIYAYNVNDNVMLGAFKGSDGNNGTEVRIRSVVNGCVQEWVYSPSESKRNLSTSYGTYNGCINPVQIQPYNPQNRFWFDIAQGLEDGKSQWTEPNQFAENAEIGMSLITKLNVNGTEYVFLAEITRERFAEVVDIANLPDGAVAFVVTPGGNVVTATDDQIMLQSIQSANGSADSAEIELVVDDEQTKDTLDHFLEAIEDIDLTAISVDSYIYKGEEDGYMIQAFPFYMMYVDFFNGANIALSDGEVGYIVISYDQSYLDTIKLSFYISWGIFAFMLFVSCLIVCLNVESDQQTQKDSASMGMGARAVSIGKVRRTGSMMAGAFYSTANLMKPHHSNQSFTTGGGTVRRKGSKLRDMSPMPNDTNGAIQEEEEFEDDSDFSINTDEEEKEEEEEEEDNGPIKKLLSDINEEDENEADEFSMQKDEDEMPENDMDLALYDGQDKIEEKPKMTLAQQPDTISQQRSGTGTLTGRPKSLSPEDSHHFDSKSTEQAMMVHSGLHNKSVTEDAMEAMESRNDTDVLDTIYDNVIEHSQTGNEVKVANRPLKSGQEQHSAPIKEEEEMTPRQLGHKFSKDTVLSNSASPTAGTTDPNANPADNYITPPTAPITNGDNVLNLPTMDTPSMSPDGPPKLTDGVSADSTSPLKGEDDDDDGRTDNLPDKNPDNKGKKTVSFHMEIDSTAAKLPPPGPDGGDTLPDDNAQISTQFSIDVPGFTPVGGSSVPSGSPSYNTLPDAKDKTCTQKYCHCEPLSIIIIELIVMVATFMSILGVWVLGTNLTSDALIADLMTKQEYFAVSDEVYKIFYSSDMIFDLLSGAIIERDMILDYDGILPNVAELQAVFDKNDIFFTRLMKTYTEPNAKYRQYYIYTGTTTGNFQGARWYENPNDPELYIGHRNSYGEDRVGDIGTLYDYKIFAAYDNGTRNINEYISETNEYDPRCRSWYLNAIRNGFVGNITQAFPKSGGFEQFYNSETPPALDSDGCQSAKATYLSLFRLENCTVNDGEYIALDGEYYYAEDNITYYAAENCDSSYVLNGDKNSTDLYKLAWDRYVFSSRPEQGLTASGPVVDPKTGELMAVVAIDYTMDDLSAVLTDSIGNNDDWYAWIFEASQDEPYVVASSDGHVLIDAESISGCIQLAEQDQKIPTLAIDHNNTLIKVMSKEIVNVYGIDYVSNLSKDATEPQNLRVPIDLPLLEVGRIHYYPEETKQEDSIDWVIAKTISTADIESGESNDFTICVLCLAMLTAVTMLTFREFKVKGKSKYDKEIDPNEFDPEDLKRDPEDYMGYFYKMEKMKPIIEGSANKLWEMACADYDGIITTKSAKDFMAQRANQHVSAHEHNSFMFLMCALEYRDKWSRLKFLQFLDSNWYSIPMQIIIFTHLIMTIFEPSTPLELRTNGTSDALVIIIAIFIAFEALDVFLIGCQRYMEFTVNPSILKQLYQLNYGVGHKWSRQMHKFMKSKSSDKKLEIMKLIFFGPKSSIYLCHVIVFMLVLVNFILQITLRISPFAYYVPILPLLIIIKNEHILHFLSEFFFALNFARDVIFSYVCFIMIFAILGVSLFGDHVNNESSSDSFKTIQNAFITSFVYISTSENYDDIVYATIASDYYSGRLSETGFWIILANVIFASIVFVVFGLFIFIPMIIHKFEEAFSEKKIITEQDNKFEKMNAIIAAFIMLDMNGDMGIDMDEFGHLVEHSILINKNKMMAEAFDYIDGDGSGELDLYEFTDHLLTQQFRDKLFVTTTKMQNKFQAWLECNVFRRYRVDIVILIVLVVPAFTISLMQNLKGINDPMFDGILTICFISNFIEIHLRWFAFGRNRYFDLKRYPNPPYVVAAVSKYTKSFAEERGEKSEDDRIIRLSSAQRKWAVHHLRNTRPLSILEKSTLSIIHRIEFTVIWFTFLSFLIVTAVFEPDQLSQAGKPGNIETQGYQRYFLQLGILIRIFTLLRSNQKLIYIVFTVFSAFASLFAFLFLLIYTFARVGCALFDEPFDIVIDDIYKGAESIIASFDTTGDAMLTLLQLMIGEGWHEIMYLHMIARSLVLSGFFIFYILIVTIIISNVFVGLFLSDVDELKKEQSDDELKKKFNKSKDFEAYAVDKLGKLQYQLSKIKAQELKIIKQMESIKGLVAVKQAEKNMQNNQSNMNMMQTQVSNIGQHINRVSGHHTQYQLGGMD